MPNEPVTGSPSALRRGQRTSWEYRPEETYGAVFFRHSASTAASSAMCANRVSYTGGTALALVGKSPSHPAASITTGMTSSPAHAPSRKRRILGAGLHPKLVQPGRSVPRARPSRPPPWHTIARSAQLVIWFTRSRQPGCAVDRSCTRAGVLLATLSSYGHSKDMARANPCSPATATVRSHPFRALLVTGAVLISVGVHRIAAQTALAATASPQAQQAREEVEHANAQYVKAFGDADVNKVVALYDTAATELLPKGRIVRGRAALLDYWGEWIKSIGPIKLTLAVDEFWYLGERAFETGKYTTVYKTKAGKEETVGGNYATLWKHEGDGSWKILTVFDTPQ